MEKLTILWYNLFAKFNKIVEVYLRFFVWVLEALGVVRWTERFDRKEIVGRSLVIIDEARKRGLKVDNLIVGKKHSRFFRVKVNRGLMFFENIPLGNSFKKVSDEITANKWLSKNFLKRAGFDVPRGQIASSFSDALRIISKINFPVVVKPLRESLSNGVTVNIRDFKRLKEAIKVAKEYGHKFLIEEFLIGQNYRVTVVDGKVIGACLRNYPQVIGDERHTVKELIGIKNKDPRRGTDKNFTLQPVKIDGDLTHELLIEQKLTLNSIPKKNQVVILNKKINLGSGADTVDVTDLIHPEISELSSRVAEIFDAKVLGLDLLTPDISQAPSEKNFVSTIEVNAHPFIDMHHYPYQGKPRNIAAAIWDMVLKEVKS